MSKNEASLLVHAAQGKKVSEIPIWFMRQAGRYLPEYQEVRKDFDFLTICFTPEIAARVSLQPFRRYNLDAVIIFTDILTPLIPMGMELTFQNSKGPIFLNPIRSEQDVNRLSNVEIQKDLNYVFKTLEIIKAELPDKVALIGFAGAPFTLSCFMIEGKSPKTLMEVKSFIYHSNRAWTNLMDKLTDLVIDYLSVKIESGADVIQLFDTLGGNLSKSEYRKYSLPWIRKIVRALKKYDTPIILYINGGNHLLEEYLASEADVASIDWRTSLHDTRKFLQNRMAVQGNLDPYILLADKETIINETNRVLSEIDENRGYIFNLGHGILPNTPVDAVETVIEVVKARKYKSRE